MTDELSTRSRALIDAARRQGGPSTAQKAALTAAVVSATTGTAAAMSGSAAVAGVSIGKLVGAGLLAAVVGIGGTVTVKQVLAPPHAPVVQQAVPPKPTPRAPAPVERSSAPPAIEQAPSVEPATTAPEPTPAPPAPHAASPGPSAPVPSPPPAVPEATPDVAPAPRAHATPAADTSSAEITALGAALEALEANDPKEALSVARKTRLEFPHGVLRPELTVVEIEALCALGRATEARELADAMPQADRTPLVLEKLRRSCANPGREK